MYQVTMLSFAKQDIKDAALWYNSRQRGLGKRFTTHIRGKINYLKQDPHIVTVRYDEVRTAVLDIFPFMIHYIIDETQKLIIITAVLHTSRNPDMWKSDREQ